jgi:hypothetical protein
MGNYIALFFCFVHHIILCHDPPSKLYRSNHMIKLNPKRQKWKIYPINPKGSILCFSSLSFHHIFTYIRSCIIFIHIPNNIPYKRTRNYSIILNPIHCIIFSIIIYYIILILFSLFHFMSLFLFYYSIFNLNPCLNHKSFILFFQFLLSFPKKDHFMI